MSILSRASQRSNRGFSLLEVVVALAIIGLGLVSIVELYSIGLRGVKKSSDHTLALVHAGSLMDEAFAMPELEETVETFEFDDGMRAEREVVELPAAEDEKTEGLKSLMVKVTVSWPVDKSLSISARRTFFVNEGK